MSLQKSEAIVLKSQRQGETSKILTIYTRAFGKIKVIAKGARSSKSRFGGSLEPPNYISILFYDKETRELQFLSQADIITTFSKIRRNLEKTVLAMAVCELVDRLETGVAPNPHLFRLLLEVLQCINNAISRPMNCFRAYQVHILDVMGIKPNLSACMNCHRQTVGEVIFDISHAGYVCEKCVQPKTAGMLLSPQAIQALKIFQSSAIAKLNGLLTTVTAQQQVDALLSSYLKYHVEGVRELQALKFLKNLKHKTP
ncbi:MAG: DNA repair protein RecO [bacterium]